MTQDPVSDLREQLRALGYLDARVDRFVLGQGGARALAVRASLRLGVLAGGLLGPAAVLGLSLRAPGLVTGPTDAFVLALYLVLIFGVASALAALLAISGGSLLASRAAVRTDVARQAARAASLAGIATMTGALAYLVFWWRTIGNDAASVSVGASSGMLLVAVAVSLLLGHGVIVTVLALVAERGQASALRPGLPLSSPRALGALAAIAFVGGAGLFMATNPRVAPAPTLTVVPTGERVLVLAIDGVDEATLRRLAAEGRIPVLDSLVSGAMAVLPSDTDRDPARIWTTIATGQPADRHGIQGLESRQVAGVEGRFRADSAIWRAMVSATDLVRLTRPAITSGGERLVPAFWEVAARAGLRTAVVHWWATWPAPADRGIVLSDRAILRLEQGGEANGEIQPAALYETLREGWAARRQRASDRATRVGPTVDADDVVRRSAELDATLIDLAGDPALGPLDLLVLYLPGLDIAQHALLGSADAGALPASATSARLAAIERYYEFLDSALAPLLASPEGRLVITVTQPGRVRAPLNGLLAVTGRASAAVSTAVGSRMVSTDPMAVAATALYALGVPVATNLGTGPAFDLFDAMFVARHPPVLIDSYGTTRSLPPSGAGRPLDREMIERMRSLGYLR